MKYELKASQNKTKYLERNHIAQVNKVYDELLSEHEMTLQQFIITCFERTKLAFMIYGASKRKGEGLRYNEKRFTTKESNFTKTLRSMALQKFIKKIHYKGI